MRKSIRLLTIIAAVGILGPLSAGAQEQRAHPSRAVGALTVSPRVAAARAQADMPSSPSFTSMAADYARNYQGEIGNSSDPKCRPGQSIIMADGLRHTCQ